MRWIRRGVVRLLLFTIMMKARIVLVLAALTVHLLGYSASGQPLLAPPDQIKSGPAAANAAAAGVIVEDESAVAKRLISEEAAELMTRRDYKALDSMAARLRRDPRIFAQGDWPIIFFFDAVADLPDEATEADWQNRMEALREWFESDPACVTPRVAMARGLINYGWAARGSGFASSVPQDGWRLFRERITEAGRILRAAESLGQVCPVYYSTRLRVALVDGSSREQYDELFNEGIAAFPTFAPFYLVKANYLLPRWHGERGEWERFASSSADAVGGEAGDMLYAQIVWSIHKLQIFDNIFRESAVEWQRLQRGFEGLCRAYPSSISAPSEYCYLTTFTREAGRTLTRTLMSRLGDRIDLSVWHSSERWTIGRAWAFAEK